MEARMTDPERLRAIANWLESNGVPWEQRYEKDTEIEDDLFRIADKLEKLEFLNDSL
jgi:hypothetical protein